MFANVVILRNLKQIDKFFTYEIPLSLQDKVTKGSRVVVPFGKEWVEGIVFETLDAFYNTESYEIKAIQYVFEDGLFLREEDLKLIEYMVNQYLCTYAEACALLLPSGIMTAACSRYYISKRGLGHLDQKLKKSEKALLAFLKLNPGTSGDDICLDYAKSTIQVTLGRLLAQGLVTKVMAFESKVKDRFETWVSMTEKTEAILEGIPKRNAAQRKLLEYLLVVKSCPKQGLQEEVKVAASVIKTLEGRGALVLEEREVLRLPEFFVDESLKKNICLNEYQKKIYDEICFEFEEDGQKPFLIHGVTGSGKTEIYAELISRTLALGKKAILMVPEISLTPQIVSRFVARFGKERIAIIHSKISLGERHDQWKGIIQGTYDIVIGARSAIFTPIDQVGLIILDESHEHSYRSEKRPRYKTEEIASFKAAYHGAMLVMGTATPTIEDYFKAQKGIFRYLKLDNRHNQRPLPAMHIVDMRHELAQGNKSMISHLLYEKMSEALSRKEQIIILLNRKGHSTFVSCRSCGFTLTCPNCDVTLTYFKGEKSVKCNYCSYETYVPKKCPKCESVYFKFFGVGTEKVEEYLKELFPMAVVDRMDRTTTSKKGSVERIIRDVSDEKTDILIGTQMVAKGLDFKKVSLVGILSADLMLNLPHFQAAERAYQLFTQVSGRAGRAEILGEVVLQTYSPDHYALNAENYDDFYEEEINFRKALNYPPFTQLVNLVFTSKEENIAKNYAGRSEAFLRKNLFKYHLQNEIEVYPATMALLKKIDNQYRYQLLLKVPPAHMGVLRPVLKQLEEKFLSVSECQISMDLEAVNIL